MPFNAWARWAVDRGPHEHRGPMLGMLCMACYLMFKHWVYCSGGTNTINICLILSTICIFIPVSGCVAKAPVHCFARGPIMLLRRPCAWAQEIILIEMYKPRIQLLQINGMFTTRKLRVCWVNWISIDPQFEFRCKGQGMKRTLVYRWYPLIASSLW